MGILLTKMRRDIFYNKGRSISVILIVIISTAIYGGLFLAWVNISNTYDDINRELNNHDVRFILGGANQSDVNLDSIKGVDQWDTRLMVLTGASVPGEEDSYTGVLYGVEPSRRPHIDDITITKGSYLSPGDKNVILLNSKFMESNNLEVGDKIEILNTLNGTVELEIKAEIFSAEYSYNVNPRSGLPDLRGLAVGWMPLETLQSLYGIDGIINEVLITFDSTVKTQDQKDTVIQDVKDELMKHSPQVSFVEFKDEPNTVMKDSDVDSLGTIARTFGGVILLLALFAIYDNISKLIASQRNYVGTMRALGGGKKKVTLHYTMISVVLGLVGVSLGIPVGWGMSNEMSKAYISILGVPKINMDLIISAFYESIAVNLGLVILSGFIASLSAASIEPREAMSSAFITSSFSSRSLIEKILQVFPTFRRPSNVIPIRALFQNKRRTLLTVLTYSMSLVLMIASLSFMTSFMYAIDDNFTNNERYDMQVILAAPVDPDVAQPVLDNISGIKQSEQYISAQVEVTHDGKSKSTMLYAYEEGSTLRKIKLQKNSRLTGLALGAILARDVDAKVGDSIEVFNKSYSVSDIADDLMGTGVFMTIQEAQKLFDMDGNITGFLVKLESGVDEVKVKNEVINSGLPVALVLLTSEVKEGINTMMEGLLAFIGIVVLIGFVTIALFSFNTVVLETMTREMEYVNLKALGSRKRTILKIILLQTMFVIFFGSLVSIPIGYFITDLVNQAIVEDLMVITTVVTVDTYLIAIISAFIASMVGVYAAFRYTNKIDLAEATRKRVNS